MVTILLFMALAHQMVKSSLAVGEEIRLVNGTSRCSGTVEILYEGQWGRVCGQKWDVDDANVVCGQLGCGRAVSAQGSVHLGQGSGGRPTWLDDVGCKGSESSLTECSHGGLKHHDCLQSQDAKVVCSGEEVQLTCTLPSRILCNAVEFIFYLNGDSIMTVTVGSSQPRATLTKFKMDASHQGSYRCLYRTLSNSQAISSPYSNITKVVLLQPNISLSPPNGGVFWESQGPEVVRGHSFSITCSIQPQYPGGLFYLDFSGSNRTETKPAVNHSASFHFPVAEYKDQGKYSCSYVVNVSTWSFRSDNSELAVTIRAFMVPIIVSGGTGGVGLLILLLLVMCLVSWRTRMNRKPSIETGQGECIDNRHNRGEDNEEEEDYVNVENVCYQRGLEGAKKNEKEKGHSYGKSEDVYDNEDGNTQRNGVCGGSHEKINSEDDENDYVNVSA
ncbi:uncharacterized protein [Oncorhynchus clarkii lewisi]|uniref:uncharacterized protein isoform X2 n=1 Tax=Oncorhynchus clarkii lewisi TaxID=490388 RepID=UPI0039B8B867